MFIEILKRTPAWAFAILAVLVGLGIQQARTRTISRLRAFVVPVVVVVLSAASALLTSNDVVASGIAWIVAAVATAALINAYGEPLHITVLSDNRLVLPGSWLPMAMFILIYLLRYATGVGKSLAPDLVNAPGFVAASSAAYGVFSGVFFGRALLLMRAIQTRQRFQPYIS